MENKECLNAYKGNKQFPQLVISILQKEGGINFYQWTGEDENAWYFIDNKKHIFCSQIVPSEYTKVEWPNFKPILFSTEMVQAILDGRKTQTRRTKGLEQFSKIEDAEDLGNDNPGRYMMCGYVDGMQWIEDLDTLESISVECPYGKPGDILWVRESFVKLINCETKEFSGYGYKTELDQHNLIKFKPSIHMPRYACRIFLRIISVRVERLNDISEENAISEGVDNWTWRAMARPQNWMDYTDPKGPPLLRAYDSFASLWDLINGDGSWNLDPWVWVIEFEKL